MARYNCVRCGVECNTLGESHLCKDVKRRLERRERQKAVVLSILRNHRMDDGIDEADLDRVAEAIVIKLAQLGVQED